MNKHNRFILPFLLGAAFFFASCKKEYYTEADFASVKKIDTHTHLNGENTGISEQAKADNFTILAVNVDVPGYPPLDEQRRFALHQIKSVPGTVSFLTAFTLQGWDSAWTARTIPWLKESFDQGALGIKLWKNIGMTYKDSTGRFIMVDDPKFDSVVQYIIDQDKTIMGHLGEPKNCWLPIEQMTVNNDRHYFKEHPEYHMFLHPEYPSYEDQINARDHFIEKHPDMRFVGAHLGSLEWSVDELAKRLDKFPNMAVDMAERISHLQHQSLADYDKIRNFFIRYQDRLIYATDSEIKDSYNSDDVRKQVHETWKADWKYFVTDDKMTSENVNGEFKGLKLPRTVVDKIYRANAMRWFKMPG
ncbi:amidohydrolase family protein [Chryseolinea lacunae]|uniref:Amidohydrolase family protein n=1 Tax=Chryseolinea lacunae TaxID=2801331 RepID=A0ABS1KP52_9BACT|nr:amidohydrolase family protein [Chryseolinea lacunae]MBL0741250.1 amidohydrolase family protein [Chryseolinea lacunae]